MPPKAPAVAGTSASTMSTPAAPPSTWAPNMNPIARNQTAVTTPIAAVAARRPITIALREIGAANSRSMKPFSRSSASDIPPLTADSIADWSIAPGSSKSRNPCTAGKPGIRTALPAPPVLTARNSDGKTRIGERNCGLRKACRIERRASAPTTRRSAAIRVKSPRRGWRPPLPRRPRGAGRSSPRTRRRGSAAPGRGTPPRARRRRARARSVGCRSRRARA